LQKFVNKGGHGLHSGAFGEQTLQQLQSCVIDEMDA